jgi:GT2 family glycosyltransferase
VASCHPLPLELVVVDGDPAGSAGPAVDELRTAIPFGLVDVSSPPGLTRQRNVGLRHARGDVVLFLDDDARPDGEALSAVVAAYADPGVVGVTGRVIEPSSHPIGGQRSRLRRVLTPGGREGTFTSYGYPRRLVDGSVETDVEFMPGCFMSARTPAARETGFDEDLGGYALAEDEDFSYRLSRRGRIRYLPQAVVYHDNSGFGTRDRRAFGRSVVVNRYYLFRKNFAQTPATRVRFALLLVVLLGHRLLNRDLHGARGLIDGIGSVRRGETPAAIGR